MKYTIISYILIVRNEVNSGVVQRMAKTVCMNVYDVSLCSAPMYDAVILQQCIEENEALNSSIEMWFLHTL